MSQVDSFIPWAGYTTVDVFTTVEQEYFAIRNATTLYDLTPMVKYRVVGRDALRLLESPGYPGCRQAEAGSGCLLRLVQRCRTSDRRWHDFSPRAIPSTAFARRNGRSIGCSTRRIGFDVEISEVTEQIAALAVQGPTSCAVLKAAGLTGVEKLKPFEIGYFSLG